MASRARDTKAATYVYGVLHAPKPPRLGRAPKGLVGTGALRLVDAGGGYHLVVATAPLDRYGSEIIDAKLRDLKWVAERAAAHEAVVEHASKLGTLVPMKLFTMFLSDQRAIAHVTAKKKTLDRIVQRIQGCEEWGVRVMLDETEAAQAEIARSARPTSGASFLLQKKEQRDVRATVAQRAAEAADAMFDEVEALAKRAVRRSAPNRELAGRVLLDAVFLVPRERSKMLASTVGAIAKDVARDGVHVRLTGPWPAYSFIEGR
jgi:hypothetical protein